MTATEHPKRQEPYWALVCPTCKRQLRDSLLTCCHGQYGETIYLVPDEQLRAAVKALQTISDRSPLGTSSEAGAIAIAHRWLMDHGYRTTSAGGQ